jgi:periplasmic copper chaperone A
VKRIAVIVLLLAACGPGAEVKTGRDLYLAYGCAACHGENADGNGPAAGLSPFKPRDLRDLSAYRGPRTAEGIASVIAFGVADGRTGMPGYPDIPKRERVAIAEYLLSIARERAAANVTIDNVWIRTPHPSQTVAAGYLRIRNPSNARVALVSVTSTAARVVEMHDASMTPLQRLEIDARSSASLEPGGGHLMLIDLKKPFPAMVPLALRFDDGTATTLLAPVRDE